MITRSSLLRSNHILGYSLGRHVSSPRPRFTVRASSNKVQSTGSDTRTCQVNTHANAPSPKGQSKLSLPPFDRSLQSKYTGPPNPAWTWCQKVESTPEGREWMEGEKADWKTITTANEDPTKLYQLMVSGIAPRPIAFVSTVSEDGVENLAPFSWFGMVSNRPPIVSFSCLNLRGRLKDTTRNIENSKGGFVVSIISEPFVENANATSIDAPPDFDEWTLSGLTRMPSSYVKASCVKESVFNMECELHQTIPIIDPTTGETTTTLILALVKCIHVREDMLTERGTIDITKFKLISRLGDNSYGRVGDAFKLPRPTWSKDEARVREAMDKNLKA